MGLRRRGRRDPVYGVRVGEGQGDHRPADRPPRPRPQPESAGRRAGRAVPGLALPRRCSPTRPFTLLQAEEQHRDHAVIEQVFADLTSGPLAHAPSGRFAANAAWLALAAIAHNLTRAAGHLASPRLRQGARRDDPPRPDRRRGPHRPARPRPPHLAPARRLAPRARMDEPVPRRLRPACPRRLTSPDQVTTQTHGQTARHSRKPPPATRTSRRTVSGQTNTPQ